MLSASAIDELARRLGEGVRQSVALAPFTTFRVGGAADAFLETHSSPELVGALRTAHELSIPVTVLGGGSNVLISDAGIRGLVIRPRGGAIQQEPPGEVGCDAAVTINGVVRWTIVRGLSGLERWAGTPGTVGGGVHGNAHFQGRLLSEHILEAHVASRAGIETRVPAADMAFGYDRSRLQTSGEILLRVIFRAGTDDVDALRQRARESLAYRKQTQPLHMPSAGCIFQNPDSAAPLPDGVPHSAGALIDRAGLKGALLGGARVSPVHANFIVNEGSATAADIRALIERCRSAVADKFGVTLEEEIVYLGDWSVKSNDHL